LPVDGAGLEKERLPELVLGLLVLGLLELPDFEPEEKERLPEDEDLLPEEKPLEAAAAGLAPTLTRKRTVNARAKSRWSQDRDCIKVTTPSSHYR
jgi:hypothetical protein